MLYGKGGQQISHEKIRKDPGGRADGTEKRRRVKDYDCGRIVSGLVFERAPGISDPSNG